MFVIVCIQLNGFGSKYYYLTLITLFNVNNCLYTAKLFQVLLSNANNSI